MKSLTLLRVLPTLLVAICVSCPSLAQQVTTRHPGGRVMSDSEYRAYLSRVDGAITRWVKNFEKIDAAQLDISYATGEQVMTYRNRELGQLSILRVEVADERIQPRLWREIGMVNSLQNVTDDYFTILSVIPPDRVPSEWDATFLKLAPEVSELLGPLLNHAIKRADLLEK